MCYSISIVIDLKNNNNISNTEDLIKEIGENCKTSNIYEDYQLDGINKHIKTNYKIIILDFDNIKNIENFIEIIISFKNIKIEYIYHENNPIYISKKYLNAISKTILNKKNLEDKIIKNKTNTNYKNIYKLLNSKSIS